MEACAFRYRHINHIFFHILFSLVCKDTRLAGIRLMDVSVFLYFSDIKVS
jgi:hypothetical protein